MIGLLLEEGEDAAALAEVESSTFEPARLDGEPVASVTTRMITFDLHMPRDSPPQ